MIVQRGFPQPPSLHEQRLRDAPVGHFFDVITNGYGVMYPYASRVSPRDRWAIIAYIRALQLSQHATPSDADADGLKEVLLGSNGSGSHFVLDLGLLSLSNDPGTTVNDDLFGDTESINIAGGSNEHNTLVLRASDVLDVTDNTNSPALQILGTTSGAGKDTVMLVDQDGGGAGAWAVGAIAGEFTTYTYAGSVSVQIQTGLTVLLNQPDPL